MEYFTVFNQTGAVAWVGSGTPGTIANMRLNGELFAYACTEEEFEAGGITIDRLKLIAGARVDEEADQFCLQFVSGGVTQSMRYQQKLAEAKAWQPGSNPAGFPFLALEAAATGQTIDALVATVLAKAAEWLIISAKVEAARMKAKTEIAAAQNAAQIHAASQVDWQAAIAGSQAAG